jgi:hypothetical protein
MASSIPPRLRSAARDCHSCLSRRQSLHIFQLVVRKFHFPALGLPGARRSLSLSLCVCVCARARVCVRPSALLAVHARTEHRSAGSVCRNGWELRQACWQRGYATGTRALNTVNAKDGELRTSAGVQNRRLHSWQQRAATVSRIEALLAAMVAHGRPFQSEARRSLQLLGQCNQLLRKRGPRSRQHQELCSVGAVRALQSCPERCISTALTSPSCVGTVPDLAGTHRSIGRSRGCGRLVYLVRAAGVIWAIEHTSRRTMAGASAT